MKSKCRHFFIISVFLFSWKRSLGKERWQPGDHVSFESKRNPPRHGQLLYDDFDRKCDKIQVDYCKNFGYNRTRMPNVHGMERQTEAKMELDTYKPLVETKCSDQLQFFLCAVFLPMCHELRPDKPILPCEGWCWMEYNKCNRVVESFGYNWSEKLNCSQFPDKNGNDSMCMEGPKVKADPSNNPVSSATNPMNGFCRFKK